MVDLARSAKGFHCIAKFLNFAPIWPYLVDHSLAASSTGDEKGVGSPPHPEPRAPSNKKMTVMNVLQVARGKKRKLTMVTAYDYPTAIHVCRAGIDVLLVGDSVGMVVSVLCMLLLHIC
jgi:Ketopantoate hydroxymethyltransferase